MVSEVYVKVRLAVILHILFTLTILSDGFKSFLGPRSILYAVFEEGHAL